MWNYFTKFTQKERKIILRTLVYNPLFIMPSIAKIEFTMNLPPENC